MNETITLASMTSPTLLIMSSMKNGFGLVWITLMKLMHLLDGI
jgi:hypothetical protein